MPVRPLGEGWDNAAFGAGDYVVRFPRRAVAVALIEREVRALPLLAPLLPLPISSPAFAGAPWERYPWPFAGYRRLAGEPLASAAFPAGGYEALGSQLGAFLRALHGVDPEIGARAQLPGDEIGRLDHTACMRRSGPRFAELEAAGVLGDGAALLAQLEALAPAEARAARCIVHGDLYAAHVLIEGERCSGIIDWGDVHLGDPAVDLSVAFEVLPAHARPAFFAAYGPIDAPAERLARYRALYHAVLVAHYGLTIGNDALREAGLRGLAYAGALR